MLYRAPSDEDGSLETTLRRLEPLFRNSLAIVVFLLLWEFAPRLGLINRTFLPPFSEVVVRGAQFAWAGKLLPQVWVSIERAAGGFLPRRRHRRTGGFPARLVSTSRGLFQPAASTSAADQSGLAVSGVSSCSSASATPPMWRSSIGSSSGRSCLERSPASGKPIPPWFKYARSVGLSDPSIFVKVVLPSAIPSIITGMRLAATYSFLMLVISEMVGASSGVGYLIVNAQYLLSVHLLYVGVIVLALLGIASNWGLVWLERRLTAWKQDVHA